jgi:hypothetical protein
MWRCSANLGDGIRDNVRSTGTEFSASAIVAEKTMANVAALA